MEIDKVKGFRHIEDISKRIRIKEIIESYFRLYNFTPVETPTIEYEDFVKGNNQNDETVSDIFKLEDRGKRKLALRYEFTFQLKRIAQNKKTPFRRYQIGSVFRDEPIGGNRWREFTQCDADIVGAGIKDEAELLKIVSVILNELKIKFVINVNNRKLLNEIMEKEKIKDKENVMKEIDKMDKLSEDEVMKNLKRYNAEKLIKIFKNDEKYFEKYESYKEIKELKKLCSYYKIKINFQPSVARGLSYYNGMIFEVKSIGKIKETIVAGGSYPLNNIQSSGISFGLDRLELISDIKIDNRKILIISIKKDKKAIEIAEKIRKNNVSCQIFYGKPSKALDYANSYNITEVIFLGWDEVKNKKLKVKNMKTGKEKLVNEKDIEKFLK